jgi:hypothetical protein
VEECKVVEEGELATKSDSEEMASKKRKKELESKSEIISLLSEGEDDTSTPASRK